MGAAREEEEEGAGSLSVDHSHLARSASASASARPGWEDPRTGGTRLPSFEAVTSPATESALGYTLEGPAAAVHGA